MDNISSGSNAFPERPDGFEHMINAIKNSAEKKGAVLTDEEIIAILGISKEQFRLYMGEDKAPIAIYKQVCLKFQAYVKMVEIVHEVEHECDIPPLNAKDKD